MHVLLHKRARERVQGPGPGRTCNLDILLIILAQPSVKSGWRDRPDTSQLLSTMKHAVLSSFRNLTFIHLLVGLISLSSVHSLAVKNYVVFGGSGKTGALIVKRLLNENIEGRKIICPVRNLAKARAILGPESKFLSLLPCDLEGDSIDKVIDIVRNADAVVISSAYSPGTLFECQLFLSLP